MGRRHCWSAARLGVYNQNVPIGMYDRAILCAKCERKFDRMQRLRLVADTNKVLSLNRLQGRISSGHRVRNVVVRSSSPNA